MPGIKTGSVYQLKITLRGFRPPIWRRVLVPGHCTLADMHWVVQIAMGWTNSHLHQFEVAGTRYSLPTPGLDLRELDQRDSRRVRLDDVAPREKTKLRYEYDFGDSWDHDVLVEKILPPDPALKHPVCLKGKGACPPEDVGGVWGYAGFLEAINELSHPEHKMYVEWIGADAFDPEAFDLEAVNEALARIK